MDSDNSISQNGDDAIELFGPGGDVIDLFGDVNVDGTGEAWEYKDAWARRLDTVTSPNAAFDITYANTLLVCLFAVLSIVPLCVQRVGDCCCGLL
jgi:hypothetical protein